MTQIHPTAVVSKNARLAADVVIGAHCVIEDGAEIDSGTRLDAGVYIGRGVRIGKDNHFFPNCTIGCMPQILATDNEISIGGLVIGDRNNIREQVTIHPSMYPDQFTRIGNDNLLMIGVHIGHDCMVEDKIVLSNFVQVAGHCRIETGAWLSSMVLIQQFTTVGKWCYAAALAGVNRDVPPFLIVSGHYPSRIRGVNKRGLKRAALDEQQQERVITAHRRLYRRNTRTLLAEAEAMAEECDIDENVKAILEAIIRSYKHQYGRYLESFRH